MPIWLSKENKEAICFGRRQKFQTQVEPLKCCSFQLTRLQDIGLTRSSAPEYAPAIWVDFQVALEALNQHDL